MQTIKTFIKTMKKIKEEKLKRMYILYIVGGILKGVAPILSSLFSKIIIDVILNNQDQRKLIISVCFLLISTIVSYELYSNIIKEYEEEGIELSGRQMQKIAIARAINKHLMY